MSVIQTDHCAIHGRHKPGPCPQCRSADREQMRRDAETLAAALSETSMLDGVALRDFALHCLSLLAELEQAETRGIDRAVYDAVVADRDEQEGRALRAERERDEWMTPFDGPGIEWHESLPSPYTYQASDFSKLVAAVHEYESRVAAAEAQLAKVPALVEAARNVSGLRIGAWPELAEALAAFEQEQTP